MSVAAAVLTLLAVLGTLSASAASGADGKRGVGRATVTVGGIVGTGVESTGADVGAQARFSRANRGKGVAGRKIEYVRTETASDRATAEAAAAELATEAFAIVPAVGPFVGADLLAREGVPFFGVASTADWYANRVGFGVTGAAVTERTRVAESALGVQLRTLLGASRDKAVTVFHDDDPAGIARGAQARRSLRRVGFAVALVPIAPAPAAVDLGAIAAGASPDAAVLVTSSLRTVEVAAQFVGAGYLGAVVVGGEFYAPGGQVASSGLTVVVPIAPIEEPTAANGLLAKDVEAFAPGTVVTPAIASGYWSADLFVRALERVGKNLTRDRLLDALNGHDFTYSAPGTVGESTWPEMHVQPVPCGSFVQSDGSQYLVVAPYRCAGVVRARGK